MTPIALETAASYYKASPGTRWFRWLLGTAERLSPTLAARAATRLFLTPLPPKWLQRRHPWAAQWKVEHWGFEDASLTLYRQPAAPHGPLVLLVHGWGGHAGQLMRLPAQFAQRFCRLQQRLRCKPAHDEQQVRLFGLHQRAQAVLQRPGRIAGLRPGGCGLARHRCPSPLPRR